MRNGLQQNTSLRQELKVNPRLYQAMDLLYMPLLDLQQHLKQELLTNPFLELVEPEDDEGETPDPDEDTEAQDLAEAESVTEAQTEPEKTGDDDVDWEAVLLDGFETGGMREESDDREWYEPVTVDTRDLSDHLKEQIGLIDLTPRQAFLADEFIGNINDDGYLAISLEDIRNSVNEVLTQEMADRDDDIVVDPYTEAEVEAMLVIIQELDPPGVGARNLHRLNAFILRAPHVYIRNRIGAAFTAGVLRGALRNNAKQHEFVVVAPGDRCLVADDVSFWHTARQHGIEPSGG